ncbi:small ribosomal subunit Rsm22 family protein [Natronosalvus caseinilyticus]|uniref:small ribosomal subunit Rsm22 family protein n=1 Tax=Natronosalvus caseinilyticus TaxID=2953747 RepID=UPI0028A8FCC9|nr:class I SAM-dependent methyltransferase [Natronosalvus caseinilyticus]
MTDQREAIRSNAKYLRQVRPIDPEEISSYVEGEPHPAVVAQILREEALDLGLVEREDGTFAPVSDEPVPPRSAATTDPVHRLPERYVTRLEEVLVDRYGVDWHEGPSGSLLRSTIRRMKSQYLERRSVSYDEDVAAGYAIYHLPAYYAAIQYALDDLAERGLLERRLRVLDVGAGVGGPALGLFEFLPDDSLVDYHAVEPGEGADVLEALLEETGQNVHATIHRTTIEAFDPGSLDNRDSDADDADDADPAFDLVLACNVLSELEDPEAVLRQAVEWLAPDGSLVAMAPADKNASIELRELERTLEADGVTVYGPTVRLWGGETPEDRGWSFDVHPDLEVPSFQRKLDRAGEGADPGEFVNVDVQFSYSILRRDGTRRIAIGLEGSGQAKMAEMERHVTNRIDLTAAKLSHSLSETRGGGGGTRRRDADDREPNPIFKISDGSEAIDHYAVVTNETALNRPLLEAEYGDVLAFENVLVLWNDDEGAYNLVVDEETIVDRIG